MKPITQLINHNNNNLSNLPSATNEQTSQSINQSVNNSVNESTTDKSDAAHLLNKSFDQSAKQLAIRGFPAKINERIPRCM